MPDPPSRDDNETTTCPICHTAFTPVRRQLYCTNACRQVAWRRRHQPDDDVVDVPTARPRREVTVYVCTECDQRYLGQQWCHDCNRPCARIGVGGHCPHCDEPVATQELIQTRTRQEAK
jgi:hypothetical protein